MNQARAYLYGLPEDGLAGEMARGLLRALEIEIYDLGEEDLHTVVGELSDLDLAEHETGNEAPIKAEDATPEQMAEVDTATAVFFLGCSREQVQQFLGAYAKSGAPRIRLKSMLTIHNIHWTLLELLLELHEEERFMQAFGRLYSAQEAVKQYLEDDSYTMESRESMRPAFERATEAIEAIKARTPLTPEAIDALFVELEAAAQQLRPEI